MSSLRTNFSTIKKHTLNNNWDKSYKRTVIIGKVDINLFKMIYILNKTK